MKNTHNQNTSRVPIRSTPWFGLFWIEYKVRKKKDPQTDSKTDANDDESRCMVSRSVSF